MDPASWLVGMVIYAALWLAVPALNHVDNHHRRCVHLGLSVASLDQHGAAMRQFVKALLAHTPYQVIRKRGNLRFDGSHSCIPELARAGFRPDLIIDGGAHLGSFSKAARAVFTGVPIYMIDPQPACAPSLSALAASEPGLTYVGCALSAEAGELRLSGGDEPNTGANIWDGPGSVTVPARPLDEIVPAASNAFLKLDLQGYEIEAMRGGEKTLAGTEVILTEVNFFRQAQEPSLGELISYLSDRDFELYDIVSLVGRHRDNRLHYGDVIFARRGSALLEDTRWS